MFHKGLVPSLRLRSLPCPSAPPIEINLSNPCGGPGAQIRTGFDNVLDTFRVVCVLAFLEGDSLLSILFTFNINTYHYIRL